MPATALASSPPVEGLLCSGAAVDLAWPADDELDAITALRNRASVRARFLDSQPLDVVANRAWLRAHARPPHEGLLAIRLRGRAIFVGAIGWSGYDARARTLELGRVMVDVHAVHAHRDGLPPGYRGVALDAGIALRDHLFETLHLASLTSVVKADNPLALQASQRGGCTIVARYREQGADGRAVALVRLAMTRAHWQAHRRACRARVQGPT